MFHVYMSRSISNEKEELHRSYRITKQYNLHTRKVLHTLDMVCSVTNSNCLAQY